MNLQCNIKCPKRENLYPHEEESVQVNNAGHAPLYAMGTITPETFNDMFHLNVLAPLLYVQSVLPIIRRGGSIINLGSIGARTTLGGDVAIYCSSKAALEHLTRNLAVTHSAAKGITINNVAPGATDTDAVAGLPHELVSIVKNEWTALRRLGTPEEIADCVCFLAGGGGARWINGATIAACGGASM
ncbi:Dehydrogenase OXI1 [Lecanosticta acicola]|uniref:Dehydrogenase OXI1 n=1 Tax=Lecanosticta acicola TaxID=111012 RepID=A0AAI8Z895_9PEZI|nr:Dehydrogenase OXI1 [Lecanosticta acicola]